MDELEVVDSKPIKMVIDLNEKDWDYLLGVCAKHRGFFEGVSMKITVECSDFLLKVGQYCESVYDGWLEAYWRDGTLFPVSELYDEVIRIVFRNYYNKSLSVNAVVNGAVPVISQIRRKKDRNKLVVKLTWRQLDQPW